MHCVDWERTIQTWGTEQTPYLLVGEGECGGQPRVGGECGKPGSAIEQQESISIQAQSQVQEW